MTTNSTIITCHATNWAWAGMFWYRERCMVSARYRSGVRYLSVYKFLTPSIFLEWTKLRSSNLANGLSMAGFTPGVKNFSWKGRGLGHV